MHLVLDYGGLIVEHSDERDHAGLLGVDPATDPYPGWLAYVTFRDGFLDNTAAYVDLLSTLTGASRGACQEYLNRTWLNPEVPEDHVKGLQALAADHTLVLFSNVVRPWLETVLGDHRALHCFETSSSPLTCSTRQTSG